MIVSATATSDRHFVILRSDMGALIRASGPDFDVDAFLADCPLPDARANYYVISPMRFLVSMLLVSTLVSGCSLGESGIRRGTPITHVQLDLGEPDVISDSSGDQTRFYVPMNRPKEEWPWDAPRTFYYLDRNLAVTFECGKAVGAETINAETRRLTLEPLVQRHGDAE
jgi:hypothetical protein